MCCCLCDPLCVCAVAADLAVEEYAHGDVIIQEGARELDAAMYLLASGEGSLRLHILRSTARNCTR